MFKLSSQQLVPWPFSFTPRLDSVTSGDILPTISIAGQPEWIRYKMLTVKYLLKFKKKIFHSSRGNQESPLSVVWETVYLLQQALPSVHVHPSVVKEDNKYS